MQADRSRHESEPEPESDEQQAEPVIEVSYEALEEEIAAARRRAETGDVIDTAHSDGSTSNPVLAQKQGLVYRPPTDPPVLPSDDPQGAEVAAGFATSMEAVNPSVVDLPEHVEGNDLDLEQNIRTMLENNSETGNLTGIRLAVRNGIVFLAGSVTTRADIAIVDEMVRDMEDIVDVRNQLEVADPATLAPPDADDADRRA